MDFKMIINYLKKDELRYELLVRGIPTEDSQTVDELRSCLRPLLKLEKGGKSLTYPKVDLNFEEEHLIISNKLKDIVTGIRSSTAGENIKTKFERNQSRLVHLMHRCDRLPSTEETQKARSELMTKILSALDQLDTLSKTDPNLSQLFENVCLNETSSTSSGPPNEINVDHNILTQNLIPETIQPSTSYQTKPVPIHKWNIKFSGDANDISVHEFLDRIKELSIARKVSEKVLFESAYELFENKARNWFVNNRSRFSDWQGLAQLLKLHYSSPDYLPRLFENIWRRTQDVNENIIDYLNCMKSMFRRYGETSEQIQLDIIIRNLAPFYSSQLPRVFSLEELEAECLKLETKKFRVDNYVPPSSRDTDFVDPEFAYTRPKPKTTRNVVHEINQPSTSRPVTCFHCKKVGHINRNCPDLKNVRCYNCGAQGVTVRTCRNCNNNNSGNGNRRN